MGRYIGLLLLSFILVITDGFAQTKTDNLEKALQQVTGTEEVDILVELTNESIYDNTPKAFSYGLKALQKAKRLKYKLGEMAAMNVIGNCYLYRGNENDLEQAFENYIQVLDFDENNEKEYQIERAKAYNGLSNLYYAWGDYRQALEDNLKGLAIREQYQDEKGMAKSYNALGNIYDALEDYNNAVKYYTQSLNLYEKLKSKRDVAGVLNNLASSIKIQVEKNNDKPDYSQVIDYYERSIKISKELKDNRGVARTLNNLGIIAYTKSDFNKALDLFFQALMLDEEIENIQGKASTYNNIAQVFIAKKETDIALEYYQKAADAAYSVKSKADMQVSFEAMAKLYAEKGNFEDAYQFSQLATFYASEIARTETTQRVATLTTRYEVEKKQKEIELLKRKNALAELHAQERKKYIYIGIIALLGLGVVALWLYYRNYVKTRLNEELSKANQLLEKKNAEIIVQKQEIASKSESLHEALQKLAERNRNMTDSIVYAKRIQDSILPRKEDLLQAFSEGFILNRPKSIVSGDFYWYAEKMNHKILVLSDCTGHGVPGAFMTVMGNTLLNEIIHEQDVTDPKEILYYLDKKITGMQTGGRKVNDGMDIAIASFNIATQTITFAGAKNHLYKVRNNEIKTFKGTKFSVGSNQYRVAKFFESIEIPFEKGDVFYMFSDGFQDQFGGEEGRKYMIRRLRELLVRVNQLPMADQQIQIGKELTIWKGQTKQTDDMLMIGVRI